MRYTNKGKIFQYKVISDQQIANSGDSSIPIPKEILYLTEADVQQSLTVAEAVDLAEKGIIVVKDIGTMVFAVPPLCIIKEQLDEGLSLVEKALDVADKKVK